MNDTICSNDGKNICPGCGDDIKSILDAAWQRSGEREEFIVTCPGCNSAVGVRTVMEPVFLTRIVYKIKKSKQKRGK